LLRVAEARARFGELLDQAERGSPVFIERRGVRFRLVAEPSTAAAAAGARLFEHVDPEVSDGGWTWEPGPKGVRFAARGKRR
jgi:hypothetical protein